MRKVLCLLTRNDPFSRQIAQDQPPPPDFQIEVIDLTKEEVDYMVLVQKLFTADSVQVW